MSLEQFILSAERFESITDIENYNDKDEIIQYCRESNENRYKNILANYYWKEFLKKKLLPDDKKWLINFWKNVGFDVTKYERLFLLYYSINDYKGMYESGYYGPIISNLLGKEEFIKQVIADTSVKSSYEVNMNVLRSIIEELVNLRKENEALKVLPGSAEYQKALEDFNKFYNSSP